MYSTNKQQQTAKYTHYSTYRSRRDPSKKKNVCILCTQTKVLLQKKVLLNKEDLFEPPKKHFNLG